MTLIEWLVQELPEHADPTGIVSSVTSKYFQRTTIAFVRMVTDNGLQAAIENRTWVKFDEVIARLAEQTLNNGRGLQLGLHVCGDHTTALFDLMLPRFAESGSLKVVRSSYIWICLILPPPFSLPLSKSNNPFLVGLYLRSERVRLPSWSECALIHAVEENNESLVPFRQVKSTAVAVDRAQTGDIFILHHFVHSFHLPKRDRTRCHPTLPTTPTF